MEICKLQDSVLNGNLILLMYFNVWRCGKCQIPKQLDMYDVKCSIFLTKLLVRVFHVCASGLTALPANKKAKEQSVKSKPLFSAQISNLEFDSFKPSSPSCARVTLRSASLVESAVAAKKRLKS